MKHKIFMILCFALLSTGSFAQVTVDIFIDGIKAGQLILQAGATTGGLSYKKSVYKEIDKLSIQIKGRSVDGGYIRKVQVFGDDATSPMFVASETAGTTGQFVLTDTEIIDRLKKGKPITMYVEKTPANTKSKEAIKSVYLGTLTREK